MGALKISWLYWLVMLTLTVVLIFFVIKTFQLKKCISYIFYFVFSFKTKEISRTFKHLNSMKVSACSKSNWKFGNDWFLVERVDAQSTWRNGFSELRRELTIISGPTWLSSNDINGSEYSYRQLYILYSGLH